MAREVRNAKNPPDRVTFVQDSNPNYTNICNADCSFCAFFRHASAKDAYQKTVEEALVHVEAAGLAERQPQRRPPIRQPPPPSRQSPA